MVTRLQQGSTNTQFYCHDLLRNQKQNKDPGFQSIPDPPQNQRKENKTNKQTNKLEMFVTSKCTSKPSRNQKTETEKP
jgi:hypothetical protein